MDHDVFRGVADEISALWEGIREIPVEPQAAPEEICLHLEREYGRFETGRPLGAITEDVIAMLRAWSVHVIHPRYFGLFNPSVLPAGIVADALVAAFNPQLAAWSHAPAANEIERFTLQALATLIGYESGSTWSHFTSGGAEANLTAVVAALAHHFPEHGEGGLPAIDGRPLVFLSAEGHHSFDKIARMAGLGRSALRLVPVGSDLKMDVRALADRIHADRAAGERPFLIVATAGTTAAGVIDPLPRLADLAAAEGLWLHVDAAWGGGALLSPRLRPHLEGIARADSVTWDAHKWLSVPMGAGMFFCRHPQAVQAAFGIATGYMPESSGSRPDPYASTVQWSRRFIGLKVFMSLAERGLDGYAALIEHQTEMGDALRTRLRERGWTLANDTPLPVVCFTHERIERAEIALDDVLRHLRARGDVWISATRLAESRAVLRACITSFRTDQRDLDQLAGRLDESLRAAGR